MDFWKLGSILPHINILDLWNTNLELLRRLHAPAPYLFIASMDVDTDKLDLFNEVYDTEHVTVAMIFGSSILST